MILNLWKSLCEEMSHPLHCNYSSESDYFNTIYAGSYCKTGKIQGEGSRIKEEEGYWAVKGAKRKVHGMRLFVESSV